MNGDEVGTLERMAKAGVAEPADVLALVAEVRRLRGLVETAYREGYFDRPTDLDASDAGRDWERSDARAALGDG